MCPGGSPNLSRGRRSRLKKIRPYKVRSASNVQTTRTMVVVAIAMPLYFLTCCWYFGNKHILNIVIAIFLGPVVGFIYRSRIYIHDARVPRPTPKSAQIIAITVLGIVMTKVAQVLSLPVGNLAKKWSGDPHVFDENSSWWCLMTFSGIVGLLATFLLIFAWKRHTWKSRIKLPTQVFDGGID